MRTDTEWKSPTRPGNTEHTYLAGIAGTRGVIRLHRAYTLDIDDLRAQIDIDEQRLGCMDAESEWREALAQEIADKRRAVEQILTEAGDNPYA